MLYISYSNTDTGIFKHIYETLSFGIFNVPNKLKIYSEESVTFFVNCTLNDRFPQNLGLKTSHEQESGLIAISIL